jgi:hypothetical protein
MASLMQAVLKEVSPLTGCMDDEECLAILDIDANAISDIEGGWESVFVGDNENPEHDTLKEWDFIEDGPSVYSLKGFMIVRGRRNDQTVWFVYEPAGVGVH